MNHTDHLDDLARLSAIHDISRWDNWGSPVGLIIFFNGMALFAILVRYAILMK